MTRKAEIPLKKLRKFQQTAWNVTNVDSGDKKERIYNEINGHLLIPVSQAEKIGECKSNLNYYFQKGKLTRFNKNGTVKRSKASSNVYFDLYEWLNMEFG